MARIISILNQKGGVGKTTTALNLGAALAELGRKVLLIDLDPQANLTHGLGMSDISSKGSIYDVLVNQHGVVAPYIRLTRWPRLDLLPSHIDLSGAEIEMVSMYGRETRLSRALGDVPQKYDYVLIDCLPSLSLLTINAMTASTEMIVPMQAHPFALDGIDKLLEVYSLVKEQINPDIILAGVLITMFDTRTNISREVQERLQSDGRLAPHLLKTVVRQNIKIAESQGAGVPVIHFDPACHGAEAYRELAREIAAQETSPPAAS
ncbi:MAG: ParA family protein [Planctomycetes bacterium]|nr:ParA family protein [Planctomycetota bacterium]